MIEKKPLPRRITDRESRYRSILEAYPDAFSSTVVDLGCDVRHLEKLARPPRFVGVSRESSADIVHDLENLPYPFEDREFDTVVCLDVLEHLENIHGAAAELFRIANKRVIITLPNPIDHILAVYLFRKRYSPDQWTKFYSLTEQPLKDRHRWFFSETEADRFLLFMAGRANFIPGRCFHHRLNWKSRIMGRMLKIAAGHDVFGKWTLAYEFIRA